MRCPSWQSLRDKLDLHPDDAKLIRRLAKAVDDTDELAKLLEGECLLTWKHAREDFIWAYGAEPYEPPYYWRRRRQYALQGIAEVMRGELGPIGKVHFRNGPPYECVSLGDPWIATLVYRWATDNLYVACWGDIAYRLPAKEKE